MKVRGSDFAVIMYVWFIFGVVDDTWLCLMLSSISVIPIRAAKNTLTIIIAIIGAITRDRSYGITSLPQWFNRWPRLTKWDMVWMNVGQSQYSRGSPPSSWSSEPGWLVICHWPLTLSSVSAAVAASQRDVCCSPSGSDTPPSAYCTPLSAGPHHLTEHRGSEMQIQNAFLDDMFIKELMEKAWQWHHVSRNEDKMSTLCTSPLTFSAQIQPTRLSLSP